MSAKIRNAPSGENTSPQDSDAFPVTGSQYIQLSTLSGYVNDNVFDSDIQFTDNTTNDADSDNHGYLPKLSGDSDTWLDGTGAWTLRTVFDTEVNFSDNTTGDADSDTHGFLPKLTGDSDNFLDGGGAWVSPYFLSPVGDGSGLTAIDYSVVSGNDAATDATGAEFEELTDGSTTTLHGHTASDVGYGHVHGVARWIADGSVTDFDLPDNAEYLEIVTDDGASVDATTYSLSLDRTQLQFDAAPATTSIIQAHYVIESAAN